MRLKCSVAAFDSELSVLNRTNSHTNHLVGYINGII